MAIPIFISHSEKDKSLVDVLVKLLVLGASVNMSEIFCASLEGMGIPKGEDFSDFIKEKLQQPRLVIILLTPNYYESVFCLCELGASWVLSLDMFPILVPPLDYDDVKAVLEGIEVAKVNDAGDMNELKDKIENVLKRKSPTAMWAKALKEFFEIASPIITKLPQPNKIGLHQYTKLDEKLKLTESQLEIAQKRIQELKDLNAKLIPAKDKEEVMRIVTGQMHNWEGFLGLVRDVKRKKNLLMNNKIALEAIFHYIADTQFRIHQFDDFLREELQEATESNFVTFDDSTNEISLVEDDPAVMEFLDELNLIREFIKKSDQEFEKIFIETFKVKLDFSNKRFWEALGLL